MKLFAGWQSAVLIVCLSLSYSALLANCPGDSLPKGKCILPESVRKTNKDVLLVSPTVGYSPETNISFGGYGLYYFKLGKKNTCTHPSRVETSIAYTLKKQYWVQPEWEIYLENDQYVMRGKTLYQKYNEFFYGIGNETTKADAELYAHQLVQAQLFFQKQMYPYIFLGPAYQFEYMFDVESPEKGVLHDHLVTGAEGGLASGAGFEASWDSRDLTLTPSHGFYADFTGLFFGHSLASNFVFNKYILDLRKYFPLFKRHVLALQGYMQYNTGQPPFRMTAQMGGKELMRGFYTGRYRDRDMLLLQGEYRLPLFWRIGMTVFGGTAEVAHSLDKFYLPGLHYNYGFGLRYMYDTKEKINIRLDFGFGKGTNGQYITVGEAF